MPKWILPSVALMLTVSAFAQPPGGERPPSRVVVAEVQRGTLSPTSEFDGTVYYKELSSVATEISGTVVEVEFEEGDHLKQGDMMVRQDSSLLQAEIAAAQALLRQNQAQLQQEQVRLERAKTLLADEVTTPQEYDDIRFTVAALEQAVAASAAQIERLQVELSKKSTKAPFDGVILQRSTELGEWKREGDVVAAFAREDLFDVIANVPQDYLEFIRRGETVGVRIGGNAFEGVVVTVIPQGDVATRTFPVKVRIRGQDWLLQGMAAVVNMPTGAETEAFMVPRDALLLQGGQNQIVVVRDGAAVPLPVRVIGYDGLSAGVEAEGLEAGVQVITKGHERMRGGERVEIISVQQGDTKQE